MTVTQQDVTAFGKVAVLYGGQAAEREVSLKSGSAVLAALLRQGVDAHPVDPDLNTSQYLLAEGFTRAFIVLHGRGGEDGVIQGALDAIGMPYTGSGVLGSAIGMDKYRCKLLWAACGLPTAKFALIRSAADLDTAADLGFPLMLKPVHEGSSIGMARVEDRADLESAWRTAAGFDHLVLAERWLNGAEYTAAVLGGEALPLIRLETPHVFYDYDAKYRADSTRYHCPSGLAEARERELRELVLEAFNAVGASGWGRVDFMMDEHDQPRLLEINTVPGMTDHSLVPRAAAAAGIDFDALVLRILALSCRD